MTKVKEFFEAAKDFVENSGREYAYCEELKVNGEVIGSVSFDTNVEPGFFNSGDDYGVSEITIIAISVIIHNAKGMVLQLISDWVTADLKDYFGL